MNLDKLREPLPVESIDFRIQSINKGGYAIVLAYKDARVDMQRLDDVVGPLNWKRETTQLWLSLALPKVFISCTYLCWSFIIVSSICLCIVNYLTP